MIPIVYRYDDPNAPVLSGTKGSMINLLTKCLVDGYGEKEPAGWTKEFSNVDDTLTAFRNDPETGTGAFLSIDEASAAAHQFYFQGYEVMTSEADGTSGFFTSKSLVTKSNAANTSARAWLMVASNKLIYLFIYNATATLTGYPNGEMFIFGDFTKLAEEGFNAAIGRGNGDWDHIYGLFVNHGFGAGGTGHIMTPRNDAGESSSTILWSGATGIVQAAGQQFASYGSVFDGERLILARPMMGTSGRQSPRGYFPGFFFPMHLYDSLSLGQVVTVSGGTFLNMKFCHNYQAGDGIAKDCLNMNFMVEIGRDWDDI